jgi:hypothetical protein
MLPKNLQGQQVTRRPLESRVLVAAYAAFAAQSIQDLPWSLSCKQQQQQQQQCWQSY